VFNHAIKAILSGGFVEWPGHNGVVVMNMLLIASK